MTIEIETAKPFPVMLNALLGMPIMDRTWSEANAAAAASDLSAKTENYATRHENGTGPFRLVSHETDGPTVLEAFDGWWDQRKHDLDRVTFMPIRNPATRTAALISGTTDATVDLPLQDVDHIRQNPSLQVIQGPELRTIYIGLDTFRDELLFSDVKGRNPLKDHRVREALYRAIDTAAIRHVIMRDEAWPAGFMASPQLVGAPQDLNGRLPYDPAAAKRLLTEAGYPGGFSLGLTCPNDRYVNDERVCEAIAAMWARAGVHTEVQSETTAVWSRRTAVVRRQRVHARPRGTTAGRRLLDLVGGDPFPYRHGRRAELRPLQQPGRGRADRAGRRRKRRSCPAARDAGGVQAGEGGYRQYPAIPAAADLGIPQGDRHAPGARQFVPPLSGQSELGWTFL